MFIVTVADGGKTVWVLSNAENVSLFFSFAMTQLAVREDRMLPKCAARAVFAESSDDCALLCKKGLKKD